MSASGFYYSPEHDTNDGKEWSDQDVADLKASLESGDTPEQAAGFLCRSGTLEEVHAKARELALTRSKTGPSRQRKLPEGKPEKKAARAEGAMHRWKGRLVPDKVK